MENIKRGLIVVGSIFIIFWLYGKLTSIPDRTVKEAKSVLILLERYKKSIKEEELYLEAAKQKDSWQNFKSNASKGKWEDAFVKAKDQIEQLEKQYLNTVEPILDRDDKKEVYQLNQATKEIKVEAERALNIAKTPRKTMDFISKVIKNQQQYYRTATNALDYTQSKATKVVEDIKIASQTYPDKTKQLNEFQEQINELLSQQQQHVNTLVEQNNSNTTDYLAFGNAYDQAQIAKLKLDKQLTQNSKDIKDLKRSFVKVLSDQKVDYYITVGRANWCEGEYCREGTQMRYPAVKVDEDTMRYFEQLNIANIATNSGSWGRLSFNLKIPKSRWDALGIDKYYRWNNSKPYAEYWIDKTEAKTFHRYTTIEDGSVNEDRWQAVSNQYFWQHYENLGMALVTKPIGYFESESIKTPEPVGLATIAKPEMVEGVATGANQYGEWRRDNSGSSFWFYYSMYRILGDFGPGRYGYNDWYGYSSRDRSRPYYGTSGQYGTFGKNTYQNSRYRNSAFSKRNPNISKGAMTGKRSASADSLRGSGASNRGKGPSRSGK